MFDRFRATLRYRLRGYSDPSRLVRDGLVLGRNVYLAPGVVIDPYHCWLVSIGDNTTLAPDVYVLAHDASTKRGLGYTKIGQVTVGSGVFIGSGSLLLPGTSIGDGAIVAAGSVVRGEVPDGALAGGNPVKVIGQAGDYLDRQRALLAERPRFGREYTVWGGVTPERKEEMRRAVAESGGAFIE